MSLARFQTAFIYPAMVFPKTRWTLIAQLAAPESRDGALSALCRDYWPPVYSYLRRTGKGHEDAEDATQGFFAKLVQSEVFSQADAGAGKLRTYLLSVLQNFLANDGRIAGAQKRSAFRKAVSMDDPTVFGELETVASSSASPTEAFDRAWLGLVLDRAVTALRAQYAESGKEALFVALFPSLMERDEESQASLAAAVGLSVSNFRVQLHRLRARYRSALMGALSETLGEGADLNAELAYLFSLSGGAA